METLTEGLGRRPATAIAALLLVGFSAGGALSLLGAAEPPEPSATVRVPAMPSRWVDPGAPPLPEHPRERPRPGTFRYPDGTYEEGGGGMPGRTTAAQRRQIEAVSKGWGGR